MILVSGATGRIGGEAVRLLRERGLAVRALVRDRHKSRALAVTGAELVQGDQEQPATLQPACEGVEAVLLATSNDPGQGERETNLIDAAIAAGVRRIVKVSALGADPEAPVSILRTHAAVERRLAGSGLEWTSLRPSYYMQNFLLYAATIRATGAFYGSLDDARVGWIDTRDVGAVAARCLTDEGHNGQVYELTGGEAFSYPAAAARLATIVGRQIAYVNLPPEVARQGMVDAGLPEWLSDDLVALGELFKGPIGARTTTAVHDIAGASPRTFDAFAREFADSFRG